MLDPKEQEKLLAERFGSAAPLRGIEPEETQAGQDGRPGPELVPEPPPAPPISRWWMAIPLCFGIWAGFMLTQNSGRIARIAQTRPLRTVVVDRGDVRKTIRIAGDTAAFKSAAVRAPRIRGRGGAGQMTLVKLADAGAWVEKGAVVAEFDTQNQLLKLDDQKAKVVQQEANILKTKANQSIAEERDRTAFAKAQSNLGKAALDLKTTEVKSAIAAARLRMAVEEAEVNLKAAQKELLLSRQSRRAELRSAEIRRDEEIVDQKRAELNIEHMLIKTPIDGMVVRMSNTGGSSISEIAQGDQVRPGMHLLNIVDTASIVLEATVNQADSQAVRTGMPAEVRLDAYPDAVYPARVAAVGSLAGMSTGGGGGGRGGFSRSGGGSFLRNVAVEIAILEKDGRVIPDLSASADIILETAEDVVRVPREAVLFEDGGAWVEVAGGPGAEAFERRRIEVGLIDDIHVEAVSGIEPGAVAAAARVASGP